MAAFRMQLHLLNQPFDTGHAALLRIPAQKVRVLRGVEVVCVGDVGQRRVGRDIAGRGHELAARSGHGIERVRSQRLRFAARVLLDPVLVERQQPERMPDLGAEAMHVRGSRALPIDELDAELEAALGLPHEFGLIDAEQIIEGLDVRHGGFAHTDGAELLGLDQLHSEGGSKHARKRGGRHPAGGSATDNDDVAKWSGNHVDAFLSKKTADGHTNGANWPRSNDHMPVSAHVAMHTHQNLAPISSTTLRGT